MKSHGHWKGGKRTPTYISWERMIARCSDPENAHYRQIEVCERWKDFAAFLEDMGERPPGTTIDRIENAGNYEPGNCRWATMEEQQNNRSSNVLLTVNGETRTIAEWSRLSGIPFQTIYSRVFTWGWEAARAVQEIPRRRRLTYNGETHSLAEWARKCGLPRSTLSNRINTYGWSIERALTTPV